MSENAARPQKKTAALYIRVSTHSQEELSPDSQRRLLLDYAASHHMTVPPKLIYQENGISGRNAKKRPRFQEMIGAAKSPEHPFDVILVWKYSRFARNQEESIVYKSMLRTKCQVEVISISEPLADGPFGSLIERIIEWMDEFYSIRLSGDVKRGMTEKAMRGGFQSRPPFGYFVPCHNARPEIIPKEGEIVKTIFQKYVLEHMSLFSIARYLNSLGLKTARGNLFEKRAVKYILSNPFYAGYVCWNSKDDEQSEQKITAEGSHTPLISRELFSQAQERLKKEDLQKGKNARPEELSRHWLSGLLKCPICKSTLASCRRKRKTMEDVWYFQCTGYLKGKCPHSSYISETVLIPAVLNALEEAVQVFSCNDCCKNDSLSHYCIHPPSQTSDSQLLALKSRYRSLEGKQKRGRKLYLDGIDTRKEYLRLKSQTDSELKELKKQLSFLEQKSVLPSVPSLSLLLLSPSFSIYQKNIALKAVIGQIVYHKEQGRIDIFYNFLPKG